jgi:hypothetical protein
LGAKNCGVLLVSILLAPLVTAIPSGETTHFIVSVNADGSAGWVVEHRYPLYSEEDVEAFRVVSANVSRELSETYRLRLYTVIQEASSITGRAMDLTDFSVQTSTQTTITGSIGIIVVGFVWTGFAAAANGKIYVGDVFVGGLSLASGETFTIKIPEGYQAVDYSPKPDEVRSDSLVWDGPRSFTDGRPMVILSKRSEPAITGIVNNQLFGVLLAAVAAAGASAAYFLRRRPGRVPESGFREIIEVLKKHGGEAPQHVIVEETGFSKASVSMMLRALESSGVVVRVKSGRTKVVRLVR